MKKVNVAEKLSRIQDHWNPRVAAELNGQQAHTDVQAAMLPRKMEAKVHRAEELAKAIAGNFVHARVGINKQNFQRVVLHPDWSSKRVPPHTLLCSRCSGQPRDLARQHIQVGHHNDLDTPV